MRAHPPSAIVLLAAGSGTRVGAGVNKILLDLDGTPILAHSVRTALAVPGVHRIVVVVRPEDRPEVSAALAPHLGAHDLWLVDGGAERHDSEYRALQALRADIEADEITVVAIHDAARPLARADLFSGAISAADAEGGAVPVIGSARLNTLDGSLAPDGLVAVQTPQAFRAAPLLSAYDDAAAAGFTGTDTAACLERFTDTEIVAVAGAADNLKVTYPEDLALAGELLRTATSGHRPGSD